MGKIKCNVCRKFYKISDVGRSYEYKNDAWYRITVCPYDHHLLSLEVTK